MKCNPSRNSKLIFSRQWLVICCSPVGAVKQEKEKSLTYLPILPKQEKHYNKHHIAKLVREKVEL